MLPFLFLVIAGIEPARKPHQAFWPSHICPGAAANSGFTINNSGNQVLSVNLAYYKSLTFQRVVLQEDNTNVLILSYRSLYEKCLGCIMSIPNLYIEALIPSILESDCLKIGPLKRWLN